MPPVVDDILRKMTKKVTIVLNNKANVLVKVPEKLTLNYFFRIT